MLYYTKIVVYSPFVMLAWLDVRLNSSSDTTTLTLSQRAVFELRSQLHWMQLFYVQKKSVNPLKPTVAIWVQL